MRQGKYVKAKCRPKKRVLLDNKAMDKCGLMEAVAAEPRDQGSANLHGDGVKAKPMSLNPNIP